MAMENPFEGKEVWFGVGSQDLYGEEALRQVAEQSGRKSVKPQLLQAHRWCWCRSAEIHSHAGFLRSLRCG